MSAKHKLRNFIIKIFCLIFGRLKPRPVILLFHSIDREGHWLSLAPELLEKQIKFFLDKGFQFVSLPELKNLKKLNQKTICLTFDDGFENNYKNAVPILKKYKVPAIFFISTDHIGKMNKTREFKCMDWIEIKKLADDKLFIIGAHSKSHCKLNEVGEDRAKEEIAESKKILENELEKPVDSFAVPYGEYNKKILSLLDTAGFRFNFITRRERINKKINLLTLPRYVVDKESYPFVRDMPYYGYELYWKLYRLIFKR